MCYSVMFNLMIFLSHSSRAWYDDGSPRNILLARHFQFSVGPTCSQFAPLNCLTRVCDAGIQIPRNRYCLAFEPTPLGRESRARYNVYPDTKRDSAFDCAVCYNSCSMSEPMTALGLQDLQCELEEISRERVTGDGGP